MEGMKCHGKQKLVCLLNTRKCSCCYFFVLMFLLKLYNSSAIITVHFFTWQARKKVTSMKNLAHTKVILKTWLFDVNTASYDVIIYQNISVPMKNILFSASFNLKLEFQLLLHSMYWYFFNLIWENIILSEVFLHKQVQYSPFIRLSYM